MQNKNIQTLIETDGNLHLSAAKLHVSTADLLEDLNSDLSHESLSAAFRTKTLIQAYNTFVLLNRDILLNLENLESKDKVRALAVMGDMLKTMLIPQENTAQVILKNLPPDVADAVTRLMSHI